MRGEQGLAVAAPICRCTRARRVDERLVTPSRRRTTANAVTLSTRMCEGSACSMRSADPTEVPPNFMTMSIWRDRLLTISRSAAEKRAGTGSLLSRIEEG